MTDIFKLENSSREYRNNLIRPISITVYAGRINGCHIMKFSGHKSKSSLRLYSLNVAKKRNTLDS